MGKKQVKPPTHFMVNNKKYVIIKKIADGGFSTIYKVKCKSDIFALKRIGVYDVEQVKTYLQEANLMKKFSHNNHIMNCFDYCYLHNENGIFEVIIVMEYCKRNLNEVIAEFGKNKKYDDKYKMMIFDQICLALADFHYSNPTLIHRDIKTENILQQSENNFVLCDFGSVTDRIYDPKTTSFHVISDDIDTNTTPAYRSPEMISQLEGKLISTKVDIWALGCLLYKIYHGNTPFGESLGRIIDGFREFPSNSTCPEDVKDLIKSMLHSEPSLRPNIYEIHLKNCKILNETPKLKPMPEFPVHIYKENETIFNNTIQTTSRTTNSDTQTSPIPGQNPFGSDISNDMNFSQVRMLACQTSGNTESSSKEDCHQRPFSHFIHSTQSSNQSNKIIFSSSANSTTIHNVKNEKPNVLNCRSVSKIPLPVGARSHSRHQSLNEKIIKICYNGAKKTHYQICDSSDNRTSPFTPCNNAPSCCDHKTVAAKGDNQAKSEDNDLFNPFENKKINDGKSIMSKSSLINLSIDQTSGSQMDPFSSKLQSNQYFSSGKNLNPFRIEPSEEEEEHSQITPIKKGRLSDQQSTVSISASPTPNFVETKKKTSYVLKKQDFPNPFLTSDSPQSSHKPNDL